MTLSAWKSAFSHEIDTEAEGAKYFLGHFKKSRIVDSNPATSTGISGQQSDIRLDGDITVMETSDSKVLRLIPAPSQDADEDERGGFCQPAGLAIFFKNLKSDSRDAPHEGSDAHNNSESRHAEILPVNAISSDVAETDNNMGRQICRAWLKNNFLQLGQPCKNANCERRHVIESRSIGSLYKDYSFKGLSPAQRNSIISQVQAASTSSVPIVKRVESISDEKDESPSAVEIVTMTDDTGNTSNSEQFPLVEEVIHSALHQKRKRTSSETDIKLEATSDLINTEANIMGNARLTLPKPHCKPWMPIHKRITY